MKVEKKKKYEVWDIVYARYDWMPWTYEIRSSEKIWLFGRYYLIRYNRKDFIHWLPNRRTGKLYKRNIEWIVVKPELIIAYEKILKLDESNKSLYSMYIDSQKEVHSVKRVNQELSQKNKILEDEVRRLSEVIEKLENRKFIP